MQKFLNDGTRVPVTEVAVPDNAVLQVKTQEKDKYQALQIGIGRKKKPSKAALGHVKKAGFEGVPTRVREIRLDIEEDAELPKAGEFLKVEDFFKAGDMIDVTGTSKGKGFAGVMKRHNFRGGPKTHGQSDRARAPGSIGQTTTPGRVYRGKKMAGRMGSEMVTVRNLTVLDVDAANKKIYIAGLVPGVKNAFVYITRTGEDKKFVPLHKIEEEKKPEAMDVVAKDAPVVPEEVKGEAKAEEVKQDAEKGAEKAVKEEKPKDENSKKEGEEIKNAKS